jgi:hypothetical protein
LLVWLTLPLVWWGPLNVDEELTLRLSDFSFGHIFDVVSTKRGGGPLHFWLEHVLIGWWPGLGALRIPSLLFLIAALPAVALLVRRLVDDEASAGAVLLTAASPIPVLYATFGRPHTLLFAWLMWSTALALKAADDGNRRLWALAGAALGLAVFVHPTAPLYALTAFAAALVYAPRAPRRLAHEAWPGAATLFITFAPYYVRTLHVLGDRYGVSASAARGRTFSGRPVWEDARHFIAPGAHNLNWFTILALVGMIALLVRGRWRVVAFCVLTIVAPVVFFSVVPASGDSALFFDRYMIPTVPAFATLVLAGCLALASWAGRYRLLIVAPLVAWLLVIELHHDLHHRRATKAIGVDAVVHAVAREPKGAVLFGSTGTSGAIFSSFDYGHPANVLDHLVALRVDSVQLVDDDSCERAEPFLRGPQQQRYGVWVFYAASPDEVAAATRALGVSPVGGHYFVVRKGPAAPRALVRMGLRLRGAWRAAVPLNKRVDELIASDRQLLAGTCVPYGELGDPDISPHWPPAKTTHQ